MIKFPPDCWNYNKIIAGSDESAYDFAYISKFNFEKWMSIIRDNRLISFSIEEYVELMCERHVKYCRTGDVDLTDLTDLISVLNEYISKSDTDMFFRLSYRSAKDVPEGRLPIKNGLQIVTAIIKSERCFDDLIAHRYHQLNDMPLAPININIVPWINCDQSRELRCFVFEKQLVAITNQFPNDDNWPFKGLEMHLIETVNRYINDMWINYPNLYDSAIVDIEVNRFMQPKLIEFNPYEKKGSTSAILFDWISDADILHNKHDEIILRYSRDRSKEIKLKR
jgi:hypothetical protein